MSEKYTGTGFAPAHITGFFEIHNHKDMQYKGSTGCGLVFDQGVEADLQAGDTLKRTRVFLNGSPVQVDAINTAIEMLTDLPVAVNIKTNMPLGCGLGLSGAGALSVAYALNQALSLNYTSKHLADIVHLAEVKTVSGLGDVTAQLYRGAVIRTKPGKPSNGEVDFIPSEKFIVYVVVLGNVSTKSVIGNREMVDRINSAGGKAHSLTLKHPTIDNFMEQSKNFTMETGLLKDRAKDLIEAVEFSGGKASQAMIGDTVFAISDEKTKNEVYKSMLEFGEVLELNSGTGCYTI
ncbi:pantoate kinase [Methanohalobium sp.]|uniref:pantoate kinase n=1 Tax=Methanohalobium sp. TaxID=2837493 RepID=UPI0025F2E6A6|nr:pantoate kinase [Methanohalobium sp.]